MAYSTSNPPKCLVQSIANAGAALWTYSSADASTVVRVSGYITNARDLGMKVGDAVITIDNDAVPVVQSMHVVSAINSNGSADLSDGVAVGSTNTD